MKDSNDALSKYSVKIIFRIFIAIHLLIIAEIIIPSDWWEVVLKIIMNILGILIIKDSMDWLFGTNIKIVVFIPAMILFLGFILIIGKATLATPVITYGGYYLVNWLSSEESMYYFSSTDGKREIQNLTEKQKSKWAKIKAHMLFILISTNIAFGIKITIPVEWKKIIVDKIVGILNNMRAPVYNDFFDRGGIISILVILTSAIIYFIIVIILVNINPYRKQDSTENKSKKPRINKR